MVITFIGSLESVLLNVLKQEMGGFGRIPSGFSDQDDNLPLHLVLKKSHCSFGIVMKNGLCRALRLHSESVLKTFYTSDWLKSGCQQNQFVLRPPLRT